MAEDGGVEPHPISQNPVFKAGRSTNTAASSSITLVLRTRIELVMDAYQASVIPFNYPREILVLPVGIEPTSMVLQTTAMTTSAKVAWYLVTGSNCRPSPCKRDILPLK